jgi:hypothetical protein
MSSQSLHEEWFVHATAWQLNDPVLYISVAILGLHILVVAIHSAVVLWSRQSSEAWNSVSEVVALAWLSKSDNDVLENCGAGIMLKDELKRRVRVREEDGDTVRLVSCGTGSPERSVMVGKQYG